LYKNTIIQGTSGKRENIKLNKESIILLNNSSIISKLISKSPLWKDNKKFRHTAVPCIAGTYKQISGIYENGEITIVKTHQKHIDSDAEKIIVSGRNYPRIYFDKGEYGLVGSGVNYWVGNDDELTMLNNFLNTKLSAFLTKELKFRQNFVEFKYFPDITQIDFDKKVTDDSLADYFGFDDDERKVINATEYPKREYRFKESSCSEAKGKKADGYESDASEGGARTHRFTRKIRRS
jgi:hypothetical protein